MLRHATGKTLVNSIFTLIEAQLEDLAKITGDDDRPLDDADGVPGETSDGLVTIAHMANLLALGKAAVNNRLNELRCRPTPKSKGTGRRPDLFVYAELREAVAKAYPDRAFQLPETYDAAKTILQQ